MTAFSAVSASALAFSTSLSVPLTGPHVTETFTSLNGIVNETNESGT